MIQVFMTVIAGESGFLAYGEIDYIMTSQSLKPEYNATSQTMVLKFGNQWIGSVPFTFS
jgi:hypothetical protein